MSKNTYLLSQSSSSAIIGEPFIVLPTVESTNNYAMGLAHAGLAKHGTTVFTMNQTAGKGQRGKSWETNPGENLAMSVIIRPPADLSGFRLSALIALSCMQWFESYVKSEVFVKWPNDIYWRDRKAAGILIENSFRENVWQWAILGIGVNINQTVFHPSFKNPVSLKQITGKSYDPQLLARDLCKFLNQGLANYHSIEVMPEYNLHLYAKGKAVRLKKENAVFETTIKGVDAGGNLITEDTIERTFRFGEVEWIH